MRSLAILAFIVAIVSPPIAGQINQVIDDFPSIVHPSGFSEERPFVGRFEFESLPEPLKAVGVNFTLEAILEHQHLEGDWNIRVLCDPKYARLIGDSIFTWTEPHTKGSEFSGSFKVVPLTAGLHGFDVYLITDEIVDGGKYAALNVEWCFDPDGNLVSLDRRREVGGAPCNYLPWAFFAQDSIELRQSLASSQPGELVDWKMVVKPPFRIGDTSVVRYTFTALKDMAGPIEIEMHVDNMELLTVPEKIPPPVLAGSVVAREVKVVPVLTRTANQIVFHLRTIDDLGRARHTTTVLCSAIFNSDGTVRMVGDVATTARHDKYRPIQHQGIDPGVSETVRIRSDEDGVERVSHNREPPVVPEQDGSYFQEKKK